MQDPVREIKGIVKSLVQSKDASEQAAAVKQYFTQDASFDHPLCSIAKRTGSRDLGLLQVYQWLRCISNSTIVVHSAAFDEHKNQLFLDMTQTLRPTLFPFYARPARLITVLFLKKGSDSKYYIARQEDYYEPQIMPAKLVPFGEEMVNIIKQVAGFNCFLLALFIGVLLGAWRPKQQQLSK